MVQADVLARRAATGLVTGMLSLLGGTAAAQQALQTIPGAAAGDAFGARVAAVGDVDLDGRDDFAVGATLENFFDGTVRVYSGATGALITPVLLGPDVGATFGSAIDLVGDLDGDFRDDFVVTSPNYSPSISLQGIGRARVYSGATFTPLHTITATSFGTLNPTAFGDFLGIAAAGLGDLNNDGVPDYGLGARDVGGTGYVRLVNGANPLAGLGVLVGAAAGDTYGSALDGMGDLTGNGFDEFAVGASRQDGSGPGYVEVRRWSPFSLLYPALVGDGNGDQFGKALASIGDVTGDGRRDLVVGAPFGTSSGAAVAGAGYARVFDGFTGATLFTFDGDGASDRFGTSVAGIGDLDGDGVPDVLVGATGNTLNPTFPKPGYVRAFSGATGAVLFTVVGDPSTAPGGGSDGFGTSIAAVGDVLTADGREDFLVGAPRDDDAATDAGLARLFSGAPPPLPFLTSDRTEVRLSGADTSNQLLSYDAADAGKLFGTLGSFSGTAGFPLGNLLVPLTFDAYTQFTINQPNTHPLPMGFGVLPAGGPLAIPFTTQVLSDPSLAGLTLWHAVVIMTPSPFTFEKVTNPVPLLLVP